jgi:phage shock protein PspC (stress-responsive transcriptional regulator)
MRTSQSSTNTLNADVVSKMWQTRPARAAAGSTIGGVCTGIGVRYKVDPTLVKVAFIVSALFGGAGILLYIASWILLPEGASAQTSGELSARSSRFRHGMRHASSHPPTVVAIAVVAVVALVAGPHLAWSSGGLLGLALMMLGWWLLYQRTPVPEPGTSADTLGQQTGGQPVATGGSWWQGHAGMQTPVAGGQFQRWTPRAWLKEDPPAPGEGGEIPAPTTADPLIADQDGTITEPPLPKPPSWDPLGAAPFAWDLPEPSVPVETRPSSRFTPIVLGLAVIAGAVAAAIGTEVDWFSPAKVGAVALTVVAGGLLVGAFVRRGGGLIPIAIPLAGFVVIASVISGFGFPAGGIGDRDWKPLSAADLRDEYSLTLGSARLDLTAIDLTADDRVTIDLGVGEFKIIAPENMNLRTDCDVAIGEVTCPDGLDGGPDGTLGPVLTIDAHSTIGNVEVIRD